MRNELGRFKTGYSGNAGGRPKDEHKVAELARSYTKEAVETLVELMRNGKDERVKGTAAQAPYGSRITDRISAEKKLLLIAFMSHKCC